MKNASIINIRNEYRQALIDYLNAKQAKAEAEKDEKAKKADAVAVLEEFGKAYKAANCSDYVAGFVQVQHAPRAVVYRETTKKGNIDWEAYAKTLGGTDEEAEKFRKVSICNVSISWATSKQAQELGL